jgi:hypothetical protein
MRLLEVVRGRARTGTNGCVRGDDSRWYAGLRVVVGAIELAVGPTVEPLDVRESRASLCWQRGGGMLAGEAVEGVTVALASSSPPQ